MWLYGLAALGFLCLGTVAGCRRASPPPILLRVSVHGPQAALQGATVRAIRGDSLTGPEAWISDPAQPVLLTLPSGSTGPIHLKVYSERIALCETLRGQTDLMLDAHPAPAHGIEVSLDAALQPDPTCPVTVTVDPPGRIVSEPPGIDCGRGGPCRHAFPTGSQVRLYPDDPAAHYVLWSEECSSAAVCRVKADRARSVAARLAPRVCMDELCWYSPVPQGNELMYLWGSGIQDVWAAGSSGTTLHYDGRIWSSVPTAPAETIESLMQLGPGEVWAMRGHNLSRHDGKSWRDVAPLPPERSIWLLWGSGASDLWAYVSSRSDTDRSPDSDSRPALIHFNGTSWEFKRYLDSLEAPVGPAWGSGANDIWAIASGYRLLHFDGHAWNFKRTNKAVRDTVNSLGALWGFGPRDIWMSSDNVVLHYDGHRWRGMDSGCKDELRLLWGTGPADVWGVDGYGFLCHYDGSKWADFHLDAAHYGEISSLNAFWSSAPTDIWAVGRGGRMIHYDGKHWQASSRTLKRSDYYSAWGSGPADLWAGTDDGTLVHWNGRGWEEQPERLPYLIHALGGSGARDVWAGGPDGKLAHYDGHKFSPVVFPSELWVSGLWGSNAMDVWAVTADLVEKKGGQILHYDGHAWSIVKWLRKSPMRALWGSSATDIWASGEQQLLHYDGRTWTLVPIPGGGGFSALWGSGMNDVWAIGGNGKSQIYHYDGASWSLKFSHSTTLSAISGSGSRDVWFISNALIHYDGKDFTVLRPRIGGRYRALWASEGELWLFGEQGMVLRHAASQSSGEALPSH